MNRLKIRSVAGKLVVAFVLLSLAWATLCLISFRQLSNTKRTYSGLLNENAVGVIKTKEIQYNVEVQSHALVAYMNSVRSGSLGDIQSAKKLDDANDAVGRLATETGALLKDAADRDGLSRIAEWNRDFRAKADETIEALETNVNKASMLMKTKIDPLTNQMYGKTGELVNRQQLLMANREAAVSAQTDRTILEIGIASLVLFFSAVASSYWFARRTAKPIATMAEMTERIAAGNLKVERTAMHNSADEIGQLTVHFLGMADNLRELIERIAVTADEIGESASSLKIHSNETKQASGHIAAAMEDVQQSVEQQSRSVDETERSAREMAESVGGIAIRARNTAERAEEMRLQADRGAKEMAETSAQMEVISESIASLQESVIRSGEKTERIGAIVGVISAVAKQTQILALNATIEASRAGTQGQGFSVIAEEVRKLSMQTAESAGDIGRFVEEMVSDARTTIGAAERSRQETGRGVASVRSAKDAFDDLRNAFGMLSAQIREIDDAAERIDRMTAQVKEAMATVLETTRATNGKTQEVSASTEEQFASMEEVAASTEALGRLAKQLQETTGKFRW